MTLLTEYIKYKGLRLLEGWEIVEDKKDSFWILTPNGAWGVTRCTYDFWRNKHAD